MTILFKFPESSLHTLQQKLRQPAQGFVRCSCKKCCLTNRRKPYLCKKKAILCNSKCHKGLSCCNKPDEGAENWGIIELQGDLESREGGSLESKFVGDLHYTVQGGIPTLIIGHHILYGKAVDMDKPFAVLEKTKYTDEGGVEKVKHIVKALIRKKLIFKVRPKPIIASVPGT